MKTPKKLTPPVEDKRKELHFEVEERCNRDYHSGERFGSWERENSCSLKKISRNRDFVNKWGHYSYKVPDEVYNAQMLYAVIVTYSSGDSFGTSSGNFALAYVTENADEALKVKNAIEGNDKFENSRRYSFQDKEGNDSWDKVWKHNPKSVNGVYSPWSGYFERIENVNIVFLPVMG